MALETRPIERSAADAESADGETLERITVVRPLAGWIGLGLKEIWAYRELLYFFAWRDIKVRYKQTVLGASWAILQPVFTMLVFSVFFGRLAGVPSDGIPYPVFSLAALVPWTLFAHALTQAANSLVLDASLITRVYFPRLIVPAATTLASLLDFLLAFGVLLVVMAIYGVSPTSRIFVLPAFVVLAVVTSLGVGFWLSALNVQYRDVRYALPFLVQAWLFITPIAYPSSLLDEPWRTVYGLNPMAGVVEGFRWALLDATTTPGSMLLVSAVVALAVLLSGAYYFRRVERKFADVV